MFPQGLKQPITYWTATPDAYGGYTFGAPQALQGFWIDKAELFRDDKGEQVVSRSVCFVKEALAQGGYLLQGTSVATNPTQVAGARQIKGLTRVTAIKLSAQISKALMR